MPDNHDENTIQLNSQEHQQQLDQQNQQQQEQNKPFLENDWQTVKRKRQVSPEQKCSSSTKSRKISDFMSISTGNRFKPLETPTATEEKVAEVKVVKPPPIFLPGVNDICPLNKLLNDNIGAEYSLKILRFNEVKIQVNSEDAFSKMVKIFQEQRRLFHTYQMKSQRKYRVVIRNLHHSTNIDEIKEELEVQGHEVANVHNIRHRATKEPLSMFYVDLVPSQNNKKVFDIKTINHTRIVIEPPRQKRETPQCTRCQRYGHTKAYCFRDPRCVKCGDYHLTKNCQKNKDTDAVCALCCGKHPANYKGCEVYKQLQERKYPALRPKSNYFPQTSKPILRNSLTNPNVSFAQAVRGETMDELNQDTPQQTQTSSVSKMEQLMITLMERMDTMFNLLTTIVTKLVNVSKP